MQKIENLWNKITDEIKGKVNEASMKLFLTSITPVKIEEGTLYLEAVNDLCKDWIEKKYRTIIQKILQDSAPQLNCSFVSKPKEKRGLKPVQLSFFADFSNKKPEAQAQATENNVHRVDGMFNSKYTFETFVVGKSNQFANAVCHAVSKNLGSLYNPLFIYGGVGLGKTHLMQAIGHEVLKGTPKGKVAYLSSEAFTNEFIEALTYKKTNEFRAKYRRKDLLLIDDVQFFAGKESVIEEFFHTFNELFQNKKQIVLTSDSPPKKIGRLDERLVSRFEMGVVADVQAPDLEMRAAILKRSAERVVVKISDETLMYLAQSVTTNIRELEGAFNRIVAYSGIVNRPVDKDLIDQVLKDFFRENTPGKITIPWIQKRVAEYYDIPEVEMTSKRRAQNLVLPRQIAMRLVQMFTDSSLNQIGSAFGGRDHTTVIHSVDKVEKLLKSEKAFAEQFERIKRYITPQQQ